MEAQIAKQYMENAALVAFQHSWCVATSHIQCGPMLARYKSSSSATPTSYHLYKPLAQLNAIRNDCS
jgi:hypothetical protein